MHAFKALFQRPVGARNFFAGIAGGFHHHLCLTRDCLVQRLHVCAQIPGEPFQGVPLLAQPLRKLAGIVRAGIGDRFQPQPFVANFPGHRLHCRQGMRHRPIHFSGGLLHLLCKGNALSPCLAGRRHQADGSLHHQCIGGRGATIGSAHISGHDHQESGHDQRHATPCQNQWWHEFQLVHTPEAHGHGDCTDDPENSYDKSSDNHPAAAMTGELEVLRRLLPDKQIAARRASGGHIVHNGSIPRHFARRETTMCAFMGGVRKRLSARAARLRPHSAGRYPELHHAQA